MNFALDTFTHEEFGQVRVICEDGVILFCGRDVAAALGYAKPQNAVNTHCKGALKRGILTAGGPQQLSFIPEGDVYRLIFSSKLPGADRFERWVCDEVLPSIRRHGGYIRDGLLRAATDDPGVLLKLAEALLEEKARGDSLAAENEMLGAKALYFDAFVDVRSCTNIRTTAKELGVPERAFCRFLQDEGYMFRCPAGNLMPYNKPKCAGLFVVKDYICRGHTGSYALITPQGKLALRAALSKPETR